VLSVRMCFMRATKSALQITATRRNRSTRAFLRNKLRDLVFRAVLCRRFRTMYRVLDDELTANT